MLGTNFPVSEYYRNNIIDAETLTRGGMWWTAILLISDPNTGKPFLSIYRWQKTENGWKKRKSFSCRRKEEAAKLVETIGRFAAKLP